MASRPVTRSERDHRFNSDLTTLLNGMLSDATHSDLTLVCGPHTFRLHKAIVCRQSGWFAIACKPGTFQEGATSTITIPETSTICDRDNGDHADIIAAMVKFMYGDKKYFSTMSPRIGTLRWRAALFIRADKYQIPAMKADAALIFDEAISTLLSDPEFEGKGDSEKFLRGSLTSVVETAYSGTTDGSRPLRDSILRLFRDDSWQLLRKPIVLSLVAQNAELNAEVIALLRDKAFPPPTQKH